MQPQRLVNIDIVERRARAAEVMRVLQYVPRNQPVVGCTMPPLLDSGSVSDGENSDELPDPFADDDPNPELTEMRKVCV